MQPPPPGAWTMTGRQPAPTMPAGLPGGRAPAHASPPVPRLLEPWGTPGPPKWRVFGGSGLRAVSPHCLSSAAFRSSGDEPWEQFPELSVTPEGVSQPRA